MTKTISTSRDEVQRILQVLERLRVFLSTMLTPGLNNDVDSICISKLKIKGTEVGVGIGRYFHL